MIRLCKLCHDGVREWLKFSGRRDFRRFGIIGFVTKGPRKWRTKTRQRQLINNPILDAKELLPDKKIFSGLWREFPGRPKRPSGNSGRPKWQYATLNELPTFVLFPEILMLAPQIDQPNPSTHISIDLSIIVLLTYLLIRLLAPFLLFWLGSATDHRLHTPTATLFQHKAWIDQIQGLWVLCVCLFHLSQSNAAKAMLRVT